MERPDSRLLCVAAPRLLFSYGNKVARTSGGASGRLSAYSSPKTPTEWEWQTARVVIGRLPRIASFRNTKPAPRNQHAAELGTVGLALIRLFFSCSVECWMLQQSTYCSWWPRRSIIHRLLCLDHGNAGRHALHAVPVNPVVWNASAGRRDPDRGGRLKSNDRVSSPRFNRSPTPASPIPGAQIGKNGRPWRVVDPWRKGTKKIKTKGEKNTQAVTHKAQEGG